jgi:hypothetical protein
VGYLLGIRFPSWQERLNHTSNHAAASSSSMKHPRHHRIHLDGSLAAKVGRLGKRVLLALSLVAAFEIE